MATTPDDVPSGSGARVVGAAGIAPGGRSTASHGKEGPCAPPWLRCARLPSPSTQPGRAVGPRSPSLAEQVGYAFAETGINAVETLVRIYLLIFYTDEVGLSPSLAGFALGAVLLLDAVADPVMGSISDRTRHRFGGRRGYLPLGAVALAAGLLLVFWPPAMDGQLAKFAWLLFSYGVLNLGMTVLSIPYTAMTGELSELPQVRTSLLGWRFAFANLGAVLAVGAPTLFLVAGRGSAAASPMASLVVAFAVVGASLVSWRATAALPVPARPAAAPPLLRSFATALRSRPLRPLLAAYVVATIGIGVNYTTAQYYYRYLLDLDEAQVQQLLAVFLLVFTVSILGWVAAARRVAKRRLLVVGSFALGLGTSALYLLVPRGAFHTTLVLGGVVLGSLVGCIVLIDALLTDVIDHDRVRTKQLRSGVYFGVWRFASKVARAAAIGLAGLVLDLAGFEPNEEQGEFVQQVLRLQFGPGVGGFFCAAGAILCAYGFTEAKQEQVRRLLQRQTGREGRGDTPGREPSRSVGSNPGAAPRN